MAPLSPERRRSGSVCLPVGLPWGRLGDMAQMGAEKSSWWVRATVPGWVALELAGALLTASLTVMVLLTAVSLGVLLPLWLSQPLARKWFPRTALRIAVGFGLWIVATGGMWQISNSSQDENLLGLATASQMPVSLSETLLLITQQLVAPTAGSADSPQISLSTRLLPGVGGGEASLVVENTGTVPALVGGTLMVVEASSPVPEQDIPLSLRWKGSTAAQRLLLPGEIAHIDVVASGVPSGWRLPILGEVGNRHCLNVLTSDAAFQKGYVSVLCQRAWGFVPLSTDYQGILKVRLSVVSLVNMKARTISEGLYRFGVGGNRYKLVFEAIPND